MLPLSVNITLLLVNLSSAFQLLFSYYILLFFPVSWDDLFSSLFSHSLSFLLPPVFLCMFLFWIYLSLRLSSHFIYSGVIISAFSFYHFSSVTSLLYSWDLAPTFSRPVAEAIMFEQSNRIGENSSDKYQGCFVKFSTSMKHLPHQQTLITEFA